MNTELKGQTASLKAELRAAELGYTVLKPTTPCRYDLLLEKNGKYTRVQVKFADSEAKEQGAVKAELRRHGKTYTSKEIDALVVYIPQTGELCWFEAKEWEGKTRLQIRTYASKNNQSKGVIHAGQHRW